MDARRPCPDSALLAAFLDGSLVGYERTAVVSHLAECAQCRAVAVTVVEFREVKALDAQWDTAERPIPPPPPVSDDPKRWRGEKTRAPALAVAAFVAAAASAVPVLVYLTPRPVSSSPEQAMSTLIDTAAASRPLEARLSGASTYAPPPSRVDRIADAPQTRLQLIATAANIRSAYAHDDKAPARRAVGVAALLVGELDDAIATLEIAASGAPQDMRIANDLAAAYYERAQRADRPDDLPAALSAVERVLYQQPAQHDALFNRALIITALGLRHEAAAAWQAYIARDPASAWTTEARQRLQALTPATTAPRWSDVKRALESSHQASDAELAVRHHASAARDYVENDLINRWLAAARAEHAADEHATLNTIRLLGEAFAQHLSDQMYVDFVKAVQRAQSRGVLAHRQVIAAHDVYLAGLRLMSSQRFADAAPVLTRADALLRSVGSPFSERAQIELAAIDYYMMRYGMAAERLPSLRAAVDRRQYSMLHTRAAWIEGLTAYASSDFAAAVTAYEEMLASATATGDTDQWLWATGLLANVHEMLGDGRRAWRYRVEASRRFDEAFSSAPLVANLASAAGDALAGEHHAAALLFNSVLLSAPGVSANLEVQVRAQRARSLSALGRDDLALREVARARDLLTQIADDASRMRVEADVLGAETSIFQDRDHARALVAAERALTLPIVQRDLLRRARIYEQLAAAALRAGDADRAATAAEEGLTVLEEFRAQPTAEFAIRASDSVWRLYGRAAQMAVRRGDMSRAFAYSERGRVRTPQERKTWGARLAPLSALQDALAANTAIVVLTQLDDRLQVWVIRRREVTTQTVPLSATRAATLITAHLHEMVERVESPHATAELFDTVLRPVASGWADAENVVIVADAPYNRIAFAGLWDRARNRYLVENHRVAVAPSASAFMWAVSRGQPQPNGTPRQAALVDGQTSTGQNVHSTAFASRLSAVYGRPWVRRTQHATASQFAAEISHADVVHVAADLLLNDQYPSLSRVVLEDQPGRKYSGSMFARDVAATETQAQLVALEGAEAGGVTAHSEGVHGFARGLLAAGAQAVVSPVAEIEDAAVDATWLDFHRHFAGGTGAAESLRRAQLAALAEANHRPGPWATLTVFGSTQ